MRMEEKKRKQLNPFIAFRNAWLRLRDMSYVDGNIEYN